MLTQKYKADKLLHDYGLLDKLNEYGTAHIIGSYKMDLMVSNDLDIDVENDNITMESVYYLVKYVLDTFAPIWFEGKQDVMGGKKCYFIGFETMILGELWNVDIWFFDKSEILKCEKYCNDIIDKIKEDETIKDAIIGMKQELILRGMYGSQFSSFDVYDAVLKHNIRTVEEMVERYVKSRQ